MSPGKSTKWASKSGPSPSKPQSHTYGMNVPYNDIAALVRFYDGLHLTPAQIRGTVEGRLSWDNQMKQVLTELFEA